MDLDDYFDSAACQYSLDQMLAPDDVRTCCECGERACDLPNGETLVVLERNLVCPACKAEIEAAWAAEE